MVVDTSVLLSVLFAEPTSGACVRSLQAVGGRVTISPINWMEIQTIVSSRRPGSQEELPALLSRLPLHLSVLSGRIYTRTVEAQLRYDLNFGECSTYALATAIRHEAILTLNPRFRQTDAELIYPGE